MNGESVLISPLVIVVVMISRWRQLFEAGVLGGWSQRVCVRVCLHLIYKPPKPRWSTRVKITYVNSKEMSPSIPRGTCKPGTNSQWFNSFKIAISLAFLGETAFHQGKKKKNKIMGKKKSWELWKLKKKILSFWEAVFQGFLKRGVPFLFKVQWLLEKLQNGENCRYFVLRKGEKSLQSLQLQGVCIIWD